MLFTTPQIYLHLLIAILMLSLPGVALVMAIHRIVDRRRVTVLATLLPGIALSIALWPLLLLYVSLVGLRFAPWLTWVALIMAGLYIAYEAWTQQKAPESGINANSGVQQHTPVATHASRFMLHATLITRLSLLGITLIYFGFRLGDISGLDVPMFGDSLHHTMITSLIVNSGQVPTGYLPYVPVETFTYHFGFHTLAAVFAMLTGQTPQYSVLLVGQVLDTLSVPMAYMLNRTLFGSRLAGLGAALLTASVSLMPAFYVNWGRYTQLAGQLLLMLALVSLIRVMRKGALWSDFILLVLSVGGLVVVHYRILIFFGLFAIALGAWQLVAQWGKWRDLLAMWGRSIAGMALGLALALPWVVNLLVNYVRGLVDRLGTVSSDYLAIYDDPNTLLVYIGKVLPILAFVGFFAGVAGVWRFRGKSEAPPVIGKPISDDTPLRASPALPPYGACLTLALWVALLVASLWIVPGAIGSYTVAITLYIPLSALGGYGISSACGLVQHFLKAPRWIFAPLLLVAAPILAFTLGTAHVADPGNYNYLQKPDEEAFRWIDTNISRDAKFLVSSELSYLGRAVTASDAGMWLPLLTNRNVSVPALNSWMEKPIKSDFFTLTKQLAGFTQPMLTSESDAKPIADLVKRKIIPVDRSLNYPQTLDLMRKLGITHVYVGALGGKSRPRLDVVEMRKDEQHYKLLYFKDGVYVFEVLY